MEEQGSYYTMAEYRPEASPSEAYGTLTKCPLVAHCRLEAGGY